MAGSASDAVTFDELLGDHLAQLRQHDGRATAIGMPFVTVFLFGTFGLVGVIATVVFMLLVLIASVLALNVSRRVANRWSESRTAS